MELWRGSLIGYQTTKTVEGQAEYTNSDVPELYPAKTDPMRYRVVAGLVGAFLTRF